MQRTVHRPHLRRKNDSSQIVAYAVILILLVAFFMTFGLQVILKTSSFIAGFGRSNEIERNGDSGVVVAPVLYDIPDATNSARLAVSGSSSGEGVVTLFVNDDKTDEFDVTSDEPDFETIVALTKDSNDIYAQFKNENGKIKDSDTFTVLYIREKPTLTISSPSDGSTTDDSEVAVSGSASEDTQVKINGQPIVTNADGSFWHKVRLQQGENTIKITVTDIAGNIEEQEVKITYEP